MEEQQMNFQKISEKTRRNKNIFLMVFLIVFVFGYSFFLTSKFWLQTDSDLVTATKIGKEQSYEGRTVSLGRWDYSVNQGMMEIEIYISNNTLDGINTYEYSAVERNEGSLAVDTVIEEDDFVILRINKIPQKWREISLRIQMEDSESTLKLYANKLSVSAVDEIEDLTLTGYQVKRIESTISGYQNDITELEKEITELEDNIKMLNLEISKLEDEKIYQTAMEQEDTDSAIQQAKMDIDTKGKEILSKQADIEEYTERIRNAEMQKQDLMKEK